MHKNAIGFIEKKVYNNKIESVGEKRNEKLHDKCGRKENDRGQRD